MKLSPAVQGYLLSLSTSYSPNTIRLYTNLLAVIARRLGEPDLKDLKPTDLQHLMAWLRTEYTPRRVKGSTRTANKLSPAALDNYWKVLRSFLAWTSAELRIPNPAAGLARPVYQTGEILPYTIDEQTRMVKFAERVIINGKYTRTRPQGLRNRAIVLLLLDTGMRVGEASRLNVAHIRLESSEVYIAPYSTGKKTRSRTLPIGKVCKTALWKYLSSIEVDPSRSLFNLDADRIRELIMEIGTSAKVPNARPHRFRHTFAVEYLRNGGDVFTLQRLLGHSTLDMSNRYLHFIQSDLAAAHKRASPVDRLKL